MTLADLQRLAATYSPAIKSAIAAVEAAKGAAKQAGAYPNPNFFFEQDTVGTGPGGYEGLGFNQVVKSGNKLKLQQAAAMMDLLNARLALRRAQIDVESGSESCKTVDHMSVALATARHRDVESGVVSAPFDPNAIASTAREDQDQRRNRRCRYHAVNDRIVMAAAKA